MEGFSSVAVGRWRARGPGATPSMDAWYYHCYHCYHCYYHYTTTTAVRSAGFSVLLLFSSLTFTLQQLHSPKTGERSEPRANFERSPTIELREETRELPFTLYGLLDFKPRCGHRSYTCAYFYRAYSVTKYVYITMHICVFLAHRHFFSLPAAGLFSCSWLRGTQGAHPDPARMFGPWPRSAAHALGVPSGKSPRGGIPST